MAKCLLPAKTMMMAGAREKEAVEPDTRLGGFRGSWDGFRWNWEGPKRNDDLQNTGGGFRGWMYGGTDKNYLHVLQKIVPFGTMREYLRS